MRIARDFLRAPPGRFGLSRDPIEMSAVPSRPAAGGRAWSAARSRSTGPAPAWSRRSARAPAALETLRSLVVVGLGDGGRAAHAADRPHHHRPWPATVPQLDDVALPFSLPERLRSGLLTSTRPLPICSAASARFSEEAELPKSHLSSRRAVHRMVPDRQWPTRGAGGPAPVAAVPLEGQASCATGPGCPPSHPCMWPIATSASAAIHSCGSLRHGCSRSLAAGGDEGGPHFLVDLLERLEAVGREARAEDVDPADTRLGHLDQGRLGVRLEPFGPAEAALERDDDDIVLDAAIARRRGGRSSGTRSGTDRRGRASVAASRESSAPACRAGR